MEEEKEEQEQDTGSANMEGADGKMEEEKKEEGPGLFKRKPPITSLINPVAQLTFDEMSYHGGLPPQLSESSLLKVQVDMPHASLTHQHHKGMSEAEKKQANLQKWHDYQEQQARVVATKDGAPFLDPSGDRVITTEVPERFTQEVIANFAAQESFVTDYAPEIPANSLASQSLDVFYKMTEEHEPKMDPSAIPPLSARKLQKPQESKKVTIMEGVETGPRALSARAARPTIVQAGAIVVLADHVGDNMMVEKEPNGPELPAGYRKPSVNVPPKRPSTAPSSHPIIMPRSYGGRTPPPNSNTVSSGESTPEYTPRNRRGEPIFALPEESDYSVHFRKGGQSPRSPFIPHSISRQQGQVAPETARYKWRDDGYGNMTYRKIHRIQSAPAQRTSLRTAGSTKGGNRPRTASDTHSKSKRHPCTACESNIRIPQAASGRMRTFHPATVASMMSIKALGGDQRRTSSRMGYNHTGAYQFDDQSIPPCVSAPPNMQYMSISTPAPIKVRNATDGSKAPNQSTESLVPKDALRSPSRESRLPSPLPSQGWFMGGDSSTGDPTLTADGPPSISIRDRDNASINMAASEGSFGALSDLDLSELSDQTFSPDDTPRSIYNGELTGGSKPDLEGVELGGVGEDNDGLPDEGGFGKDRVEAMPKVESGRSAVGSELSDTPRSMGEHSVQSVPQSLENTSQDGVVGLDTSAASTPRDSVEGGEPDQTGSSQQGVESEPVQAGADLTLDTSATSTPRDSVEGGEPDQTSSSQQNVESDPVQAGADLTLDTGATSTPSDSVEGGELDQTGSNQQDVESGPVQAGADLTEPEQTEPSQTEKEQKETEAEETTSQQGTDDNHSLDPSTNVEEANIDSNTTEDANVQG